MVKIILKTKQNYKNIFIISDTYIPDKISAAGMIYNLSLDLSNKKNKVTCIFSGKVNNEIKKIYPCENINLITTNIFKNFRAKGLILRFIYEISTAIVLASKVLVFVKTLRKNDLIIWYGPSVFLWLVVFVLNYKKNAPVYYILRDIFPDWLISLGIVKNPILIYFLNLISNPQYKVSDVIGVETKENVDYLKNKIGPQKNIQILNNWPNIITKNNYNADPIIKLNFQNHINTYKNKGYLNFIYLGNTSLAHDYQSIINFLKVCEIEFKELKYNLNIFGKKDKINHSDSILTKKHFWGLVPEHNIPYILSEIDCGIVSLNRNSITQNIPGKFVSYTQFGLPIICFANINSALGKLIKKFDCGIIIDLNMGIEKNLLTFSSFIKDFKKNKIYYSKNSCNLFNQNFNTKSISKQILKTFF